MAYRASVGRRATSPSPPPQLRCAHRHEPSRSPSPDGLRADPSVTSTCPSVVRERYQVFCEIQRAGGMDALPHPLDDITTLELEEIRKMARPPDSVRRVMECVHLILSEGPMAFREPPPWDDVLRTCVRLDFLNRVRCYDVAELLDKPKLVDHLCRAYFVECKGVPPLRPAMVRYGSQAVVAFFGWTVSVVAGILEAWTAEEVGGEEARKVLKELEEQRRAEAKKLKEQKEAAARKKAEAARGCEMATQTTPRQQDGPTAQEQEQREQEEEARRRAELERHEWEAQQEELERQRKLLECAQEEEEEESDEASEDSVEDDGSEDENEGKDICAWNVHGNPDRRFLEGYDEHTVSFPSDAKTNFVNVMTSLPFKRGVHYFEFIMHHIGDEQWCGITEESFQAGALVSGRNLSGWSYYCGRRLVSKPKDLPGLHANQKVVQEFAQVCSGDTIGLLVDANKRAAAFLKSGQFQGCCQLPRSRQPLYVFTHLDASGDCVELREMPITEAPQSAVDAVSNIRSVAGVRPNQEIEL